MGHSSLYVACAYKQTATVKFLLEHGADVNLRTKVLKLKLLTVIIMWILIMDVSDSTALYVPILPRYF